MAKIIRFTARDSVGSTNLGKSGEIVTLSLTLDESVMVDGVLNAQRLRPLIRIGDSRIDETDLAFIRYQANQLQYALTIPAGLSANQIYLQGLYFEPGLSISSKTPLQSHASLIAQYRVDSQVPQITNGTTSVMVAENQASSSVIFHARAMDNSSKLVYRLQGNDASFFQVSSSGQVRFKKSPDFESQSHYQLTLAVSDSAGNSATQALTVGLRDVNEAVVLAKTQQGIGHITLAAGDVGIQGLSIADHFVNDGVDVPPLRFSIKRQDKYYAALVRSGLTLNSDGALSGHVGPGQYQMTVLSDDGISQRVNGRLVKDVSRLYQLVVLAQPMPKTLLVSDADQNQIGRAGEEIAIQVGLNEMVSAIENNATIRANFVAGTQPIASHFVSMSTRDQQSWLHFVATLGNANSESIMMTQLDLADQRLRGMNSGGQMTGLINSRLSQAYTVDNIAPRVQSITFTSSAAVGDRLDVGDTFTARVSFSETISMSDSPSMTVIVGDSTLSASCDAFSGSSLTTNTATFTFVVSEGQLDDDGIRFESLQGGTVQDRAGNAWSSRFNAFNVPSIRVDTLTPLDGGTLTSTDLRAFQHGVSDTYEWQLPSAVSVSAMNAAFIAGAFKMMSADGVQRSLGDGASLEATFPERLNLLSIGNGLNLTFNKIDDTDAIPSFTGFSHYGQAFEVDSNHPVYQSTTGNWYLWSPQSWFGRYIVSKQDANGNQWYIGGTSIGLGTATAPREGVLHAGHWFANRGALDEWQSAWTNYAGIFNLTAAANSSASVWSLSLGQGNNVSSGDYWLIDYKRLPESSPLRDLYSRKVKIAMPADISRPQYDSAQIHAFREEQALASDEVLQAGDQIRVVVSLNEDIRVLMSDWKHANLAEIGLYIGAVQRWATFDMDASLAEGSAQPESPNDFVTAKLVFSYTVAHGDRDSAGGLQVGEIKNFTTRFFDTAGNRLWTNDRDVQEDSNAWQVLANSSSLEQQQAYIQALIPQDQPYWHDATPEDGVTVLTYAYLTAWPAYYVDNDNIPYTSNGTATFVSWSKSMKTLFEGVRDTLERYVNIDFQQVSDASQAHLALGAYPMGTAVSGYAYYPPSDPEEAQLGTRDGDVWINAHIFTASNARSVIAHELGHSLGLKHTGNYNAGGGTTEGPYLNEDEDNFRYTVMSYIPGLSMGGKLPNYYMMYDIAALQYRYGARDYNTGDTTITLTFPTSSATFNVFDVIYDSGGIDTLTVSPTSNPLSLNINQGEFCSIGYMDNFGICFGTVIENVIGQAGNDIIIGNTADNVFTGGLGADTFVFGSEWGDDSITDFLLGVDKISFARDASIDFASLNIQVVNGNTLISHASDSLTLLNMTRALSASSFYFVLG